MSSWSDTISLYLILGVVCGAFIWFSLVIKANIIEVRLLRSENYYALYPYAKNIVYGLAALEILLGLACSFSQDFTGLVWLFCILILGNIILELTILNNDEFEASMIAGWYALYATYVRGYVELAIYIAIYAGLLFLLFKFKRSWGTFTINIICAVIVIIPGIIGALTPTREPIVSLFLAVIPFALIQFIDACVLISSEEKCYRL